MKGIAVSVFFVLLSICLWGRFLVGLVEHPLWALGRAFEFIVLPALTLFAVFALLGLIARITGRARDVNGNLRKRPAR
jgi:hypothetical protein